MKIYVVLSLAFLFLNSGVIGQQPGYEKDREIYAIATAPSPARLEADIRALAGFGTRHTLSDTLSDTRGIGAARRWIKSKFDEISAACGSCLEVYYMEGTIEAGVSRRIPYPTKIVNVVAIKRGTRYPDRYVIMSGDIDSRISDPLNAVDDSPGANDNASGMAGVIEAARVLSLYSFENSVVFVGLSGEEQGLFGGKIMAERAKKDGWDIIAVLNNDMIGNIEGIDGVKDNRSFRIFSEAHPSDEDEQKRIWKRFYGGEVDGPSRQLARFIEANTRRYMPEMKPMMIYRLDRFGRGGHHRPFNDEGFPGVRIMETHEHYDRQHQDIRTEDGIKYGDVIEGVDFEYAAKLTAVNAINLALLAHSPPPPRHLMIGGAVEASTKLRWDEAADDYTAGYKIYWRETTEAQWQFSRTMGKENAAELHNIVIDNYLFGVAAVSKKGYESVVAYPMTLIPRR